MNRSPAPLTQMPVRTPVKNAGRLFGTTIAGVHHDSSSNAVAAPTATPAARASPVLPGLPMVHSSVMGEWYLARSSRLRSKPPAASSTPRVARNVTRSPLLMASTPDDVAVFDDELVEPGIDTNLSVAGLHERE